MNPDDPLDGIPVDLDAEKAALASLILSHEEEVGNLPIFYEIRALLRREMFFDDDNRDVFDVICKLVDAGEKIDGVTIRAELQRLGKLKEIGVTAYLGAIFSTVPSWAHGVQYASIVRSKAIRRGILKAAIWAKDQIQSDLTEPELLEKLLSRLSKLAGFGAQTAYQPIGEILESVVSQIETGGTPLVPTGFRDIDRMMGGVALGEMCIIGARPSMGKSTIARQIALRVARGEIGVRNSIPVGFISLEEGRFKIGRNLISADAPVENQSIRRASLSKDDWERAMMSVGRLAHLPLYVADHTRTVADIRAVVSVWAAKHSVKLVLVDYLQRVQADGDSRYERVSNASTALSEMFKDFNVAGIVAAQLNRAVEGREIKRPEMSDLRESGQIEQDADTIFFLHREDYYRAIDPARYKEPMDHIATLFNAKCRDGVRGNDVKLRSELNYQRFDDMPEDLPC